jgi:hypothetical protein
MKIGFTLTTRSRACHVYFKFLKLEIDMTSSAFQVQLDKKFLKLEVDMTSRQQESHC